VTVAGRTIPLSRPDIGAREEELVLQVLRSGILGLGPMLRRFEEAFAAFVGTEHAVAISSGTAGLHMAVRLAGVGEGDEVITSPVSFVASANCALFERARPVFADVDERTFNLDPGQVESLIGPRTRAILPVHIFGYPAEMGRIGEIASRHGLAVRRRRAHQSRGALSLPLRQHRCRQALQRGEDTDHVFEQPERLPRV